MQEPAFFAATPGPGDSEGGDIYPPGQMNQGFRFGDVASRLEPGGYEVVYETDSVQVGVYILAAPEPDKQRPHEWAELYFVLEGSGTLRVEDETLQLEEGDGAFVAPRAHHHFEDFERIVLLVVFDK